MLYIYSQYCLLQSNLSSNLTTSLTIFLWKGPDKIARLATINDSKYGGLNLVDLESSIKSLRLAWLGRLFAEGSSPWKAFVNYLLKDFGGRFLFKCNYDVDGYNINSIFYKELLQWWADLSVDFSTKPPISECIIWNNKSMKILRR